jgi:anti-sigma regulatory factor (Ser/Thr protein kinase)
MVELEKHLRLKARKEEIHKLEAFVEKICDQYNIFHSYFGNILFSVSEAFEFAVSEKGDKLKYIDIYFESRPNGLVFKVSLSDRFLEIAALFQEEMDDALEAEELSGRERSMVMIRMLSDEVNFDAQAELMEMVFYITSINHHLTRDRIRLLDEYFEKINVKKTV